MSTPLSPSEKARFASIIENFLSLPAIRPLQVYQFKMILHRQGQTPNPPAPPPERAEFISLFERFLSSPTTTPLDVNSARWFFSSSLYVNTAPYLRREEAPVIGIFPGPITRSEYTAIIDTYLSWPSSYISHLQSRMFLKDFTRIESAKTFSSDIAYRLELARKVERQLREAAASSATEASTSYRDFRMNLMQLSVFLAADTETLQVIESLTHNTWEPSALFLESIEGFLKTFLVRPEDRVLSETEHPHMSPAIEGAIARDNGVCAFSKINGSPVCIWPLRLNNTEPVSDESRKAIIRLLGTISPKLFNTIEKLLFGRDSNGDSLMLSSHWKTITASLELPAFCALWTRAQFALEPLKTTKVIDEKYVSLRVKWHWMPKGLAQALKRQGKIRCVENSGLKDPRLSADLEADDVAAIIKDALDYRPGDATVPTYGTPELNLRSGRHIQTGMCFELKVTKDDADKMEAFLEAQWFAIRVAAISGAVEAAQSLRSSVPDSIWEAAMSSKTQALQHSTLPKRVSAPETTVDDGEVNGQPEGGKSKKRKISAPSKD